MSLSSREIMAKIDAAMAKGGCNEGGG